MGCERVRDGVVGSLRLSMERRRLANAKVTALRYRRYQELHRRMEEEEMRKAAEVLERRKKEQERLNQYIHSLHQPPVKSSHTLKTQKNGGFARGELFRRPPWRITLIQDQESVFKLREKEISLANAGLQSLRLRDFDSMVQVRATALRDAMVDLRACNSRYPLNDADEYRGPGTEDSYLKNHLSRGESLSIHTTVHEGIPATDPEVSRDLTVKASLGSRPSTAHTPTPCLRLNKDTSVITCAIKNQACTQTGHECVEASSVVPSPSTTHGLETISSAGQISSSATTKVPQLNLTSGPWHESDGETTSYLTEELFLASLENEAVTARLIQQVTDTQSRPCRLISLGFKNTSVAPSLDSESGCRMLHDTAEAVSKIEPKDQKTMAQMLSKQTPHRGVTNPSDEEASIGAHQLCNTDRPAPSSTGPLSKTVMAGANSCYENARSSVTTDIVTLKVEAPINVMRKQNKDFSAEGPEFVPPARKKLLEPIIGIHDNSTSTPRMTDQPGSSSARVLSALYTELPHDAEQKRDNSEALARIRMSSQNMELVAENVEDRGRSGASTMRLSLNKRGPSSNTGNSTQRSRTSSRKLDIPQRIMQSVYERCDLDSIKPPGYTALCIATHCPKESVAKPSEGHNHTDTLASSQARTTSMPSHSSDAEVLDNPGSTFREQGNMYHDASGNKENLGKETYYADFCTPGSEEELNILASLERLDWKLAAITGRATSSGRNSLNSQGQHSSKSGQSAQSAPAVLVHDGPSSTTLGQANLVIGKPKKCPFNPPRPSSAKLPPQRPPRSSRQRQVVGVTNKCHGKIHQLHPKSQTSIPPVAVFPDARPEAAAPPSTPGSIMCYKGPYYLLIPLDAL